MPGGLVPGRIGAQPTDRPGFTRPNGPETRDWVLIAKGIGIVLVAAGHFSAYPEPSPPYWRPIVRCIYSFHMPLFFMLSGFLYVHAKYAYSKLLKGKIERLVYPFVSVALIFLPIKMLAGSVVALLKAVGLASIYSLLTNPVRSYVPLLWFMHALFVIFAVYPLARRITNNLVLLTLLVVVNSVVYVDPIPVVGNAFAFAPFFIVGTMLREQPRLAGVVAGPDVMHILPALVGFVGVYYCISLRDDTGVDELYVVRFLLGVLGSLVVISVSRAISLADRSAVAGLLGSLGFYSMSIYLFHTLFESAVRAGVYQLTGETHPPFELTVLVAMAAGLGLPLLLEKLVLRKISITRKYLLGLK